MKKVIKTMRFLLGSEIILKDGRKAKVKGYSCTMSKSGYEIYEFDTDIGKVLASQVNIEHSNL